jgi:succinate dehydrogenase/fumarate reductase flavoprotein subunit
MSSEIENKQKGMTRRDFMKGSAVAAVGLAAGGILVGCSSDEEKAKDTAKESADAASGKRWSWETAPKPIKDSEIKETIEADIVFVGGGIAACMGALRASEQGAKVVVVEKNNMPSGRGGGWASYTSKALQAAGIQPADKHEMHREWLKRTGNRANEKIVWKYLDRSEEVFNWFIDKSEGVLQFLPYLPRYVGPYYSEYTGCHFIMGDTGEYKNMEITAPVYFMWKKSEEQGVKFYFKHTAEQLVKDGNKVTGVIVKTDKGYKKFVGKKGVVLATGDIGGDKEMIEAYGDDIAKYEQLKSVYTPAGMNTGDGHKMGMWAGGHIEKLPIPTALHLTKYAWYCFGFLHVNVEGNRFMNEDTWVQPKSINILEQPGNVDYAWSIFDSKYPQELEKQIPIAGGQFWDDMVRFGPWTPETVTKSIEDYVKSGLCFKANTLEELADQIGVDKTNFINTVNNYNKMVKAGEDTEFFKRKEILTTIEQGPFYGLKFGPALLILPGGLEINENFQVLNDDKHPIEGLYAIGNCSGGRYGVDYPLVINGNSHGSAMTEGYLVVESILG